MKPSAKFRRVAGVFLARLLQTYGKDAPEQLRRVADELEALGRKSHEGGGQCTDAPEAEPARKG